ncbi:alpha/beta fold hydrolase [Halioxenophilus aromaticivorans]|uniref:Alpha/beta fold hydrolase n=1 Tax=Halioxenophilus aromaticivorans TaxID=1306992 RepID=A0AAV3U3U0_9ALTE
MTNTYYTTQVHGEYQIQNIGDLTLEEGGVLRNCELAYRTFGTLNQDRDNAILVTTWYSGTSKIMEDVYIGEDHALDPNRYFIIVVNQIGNGLSSSPHNTPPPFNGPRFPTIRIGDDVRAQHKLLTQYFGVESLALVVGGSMGAQQTYEWAVRYPDMVKRAAPIAGTAQTTPHDKLFSETVIDAITSDPAWQSGWYKNSSEVHIGLRRHAKLWGAMGFSTEALKQKKWQELGFSSIDDFMVGFLENYFLPMDPNNLMTLASKWQHADVSRHTDGCLESAMARITAKVFVMPIDEDMFFPPRDCEDEARLISNGQLRPVKSLWGHLALFGLEPAYVEQVDQLLKELLAL